MVCVDGRLIDSCYVKVQQLDNLELIRDTLCLHIEKQNLIIDNTEKLNKLYLAQISIKNQLSDLDKKNIQDLSDRLKLTEKDLKIYKYSTYGSLAGLILILLIK